MLQSKDNRESIIAQGKFSRNLQKNEGRTRIFPEELMTSIPISNYSRSRTLEETKIDLFGNGSALNSLFTSPGKTIGNAVKGIVSDFPARSHFKNDANVQNAINLAWGQSLLDHNERFGWIVWNSITNTYSVPLTTMGNQLGVNPPPKPADPVPGAIQNYHVGEFHIHPPLDPALPIMNNPLNWPIGPSKADETAAQNDNSPGIVRDFNTIARINGATDYTYGPWKRI